MVDCYGWVCAATLSPKCYLEDSNVDKLDGVCINLYVRLPL